MDPRRAQDRVRRGPLALPSVDGPHARRQSAALAAVLRLRFYRSLGSILPIESSSRKISVLPIRASQSRRSPRASGLGHSPSSGPNRSAASRSERCARGSRAQLAQRRRPLAHQLGGLWGGWLVALVGWHTSSAVVAHQLGTRRLGGGWLWHVPCPLAFGLHTVIPAGHTARMMIK